MITYIYDGTFEGLLTAVYEAYYRKENPDRITRAGGIQQEFFEKQTIIKTDIDKFNKVYNAIKSKISDNALQNAYYAYLSEIENSEIFIFNYIKLGFKIGSAVDNYICDEMVNGVIDCSRKVTGERHRMLGLLRFKKLKNNIFYAEIEPKYNILEIMAPHFVERFPDQYFIIHDLARKKAVAYDLKQWRVIYLQPDLLEKYASLEEKYEMLWRQYFKNIAIHEKNNYKLQRGHMPKYYWKHLVEKPQ